jgi:hypothetical protein
MREKTRCWQDSEEYAKKVKGERERKINARRDRY